MKRLISLYTLLLLILASCDSPVGQAGSGRDISADDTPSALPYGTATTLADTTREAIWQQFKSKHGPDWRVTWNETTGTPLTVFSGTTEPVQGGPEQAARTFLAQNRSLFNMRQELTDLKLLEVDISHRGIRQVRFQQTHNGVPIYKAVYQVYIRPDGRIDMANGHYYPDIDVSTGSSVSAASALQTARADLGGQTVRNDEPETRLMIYRERTEGTFALAWMAPIPIRIRAHFHLQAIQRATPVSG